MSPDKDRADPPRYDAPLYDSADVEYHNGIPFPEDEDAFIYASHWLNRVGRSLAPGDKAILDLVKEPFVVEDTSYIAPDPTEDPTSELAVPYRNGSGPATEAGPEDDCLFLARLSNEDYPNTTWILQVVFLDSVSPQLLRFDGVDVDDYEALFFDDTRKPTAQKSLSRIKRYEENGALIDGEPAASVLDDVQTYNGTGPTAEQSLSDLELTGPTEESTGEVPSLPNTFDVVGRCPACTSAVVTDTARDRVVCVDCRRHCSPVQWNHYS